MVELTDLRTLNAPGGRFAKIGARLLTNITSQADLVCLTLKNYTDWLSARGVDCIHIPIGAYHEPELLEKSDSQELLFFTTLAAHSKDWNCFSMPFKLAKRISKPEVSPLLAQHIRFS